MTTYKQAGVDVEKGDLASKIAYKYAKQTFSSRKGIIGMPVQLEGGFSGALDMGTFYLVQNCDGVGTKIEIARLMQKYDTLGADLVAMVADDAVCLGAELISLVNTIDTNQVDANMIQELMKGLVKVCKKQRIVLPGGEIGELSDLVNGTIWNAASVGIVEKKKYITGENIRVGDMIFGLKSRGFRSNGFTLVRHILQKKYGEKWYAKVYNSRQTWGEVVLTPSIVYHRCILDMIGGYKEKRRIDIHGIAHITGGGIEANVSRIIPQGFKAKFHNLPAIPEPMLRLMQLGNVSEKEACKTWNMGVGMALVCPQQSVRAVEQTLKRHALKGQVIGVIARI